MQAQDLMRRAEFMAEMSYLKAVMMIWIDETGSDHRVSSPCFGCPLSGLAPTDTVLSIHEKRLSAVAAMYGHSNHISFYRLLCTQHTYQTIYSLYHLQITIVF